MKKPQSTLRPKEGAELLGIGEATFWRWAKERADFPKPRRLSARCTVFDTSELLAWRDAQTGKGSAKPSRRNDQHIEAAIVAAGANVAPRITPDDIEANIAGEHYFTGMAGVAGAAYLGGADLSEVRFQSASPLSLLTFCVLVLQNGYTVTGESACASPDNFNPDIGRRIARENAVAKIWPLMGYELRSKLAAGA